MYIGDIVSPMNLAFQRKSVEETVQLHVLVRPEVKARIKSLSESTGVPQWAIVEAAVMVGAESGDLIPEEWKIAGPDNEMIALPQMKKTA